MKRETKSCPACGVHHSEPWEADVRDAKWGECACRDGVVCVYHQYAPSDAPDRPADSELQLQLPGINEFRRKAWLEKKRRMEEAEKVIGPWPHP